MENGKTMGNPATSSLRILAPGVLTCKGRGAIATGQETPEGFVVHAGSFAAGTETKSLQPHVRARRADLIRNGVLAQDGDRLRFTRDHVFHTSSGAADVILGRSSSGPADWQDQHGRTLKEIQESEAKS